ncbi:MAG TPA: M23 family metallopeptidase [Candidatus Saccharimonadales bacterium]|nr:M23 family metallopeptidase [Candidatus Saccharimonadales bacterium]
MEKKYILIHVFIFSGLLSIQLNAQLDHICAYSNESVVKFRNKHDKKFCEIDNFTGNSKLLFDWPVDLCEFWVSSLFGPRKHKGVTKSHGGVDLASVQGTHVKASARGKVILVQENAPGYGNVIEIQHKNGFITRYGHLHAMHVRLGDTVRKGEVIGLVGATGNVRGTKDPSHLHFEIVKDGKRVDPLIYLYCSEIEFQK